ncbi:MAG: FxLYD domain-containing protein [Actinomycetota bacterium]
MKGVARAATCILMLAGLALAACSGGERGGGDQIMRRGARTDPQRLISLLSVEAIPTSIGPVVVGEIENRSTKAVEAVKITVALKDRDGASIGRQFGPTLLQIIPPGGKAPFSIPFTGGERTVGTIDTRLEANLAGDKKVLALQVAEHTKKRTGNLYEVSGLVRNSTGVPVNFPRVIAVFYDRDGRVVGAEETVAHDGVLASGDSAPFRIGLNERAKRVAKVAFLTEGVALAREKS